MRQLLFIYKDDWAYDVTGCENGEQGKIRNRDRISRENVQRRRHRRSSSSNIVTSHGQMSKRRSPIATVPDMIRTGEEQRGVSAAPTPPQHSLSTLFCRLEPRDPALLTEPEDCREEPGCSGMIPIMQYGSLNPAGHQAQ